MKRIPFGQAPTALPLAASFLVSSSMLSGCIVVGGSSRGGFFVWPGGIGLLVMILLLFLFLRRGR